MAEENRWPWPIRFLFRFLVVYFCLFPIGVLLMFGGWVEWVGNNILPLEKEVVRKFNGSGDGLFAYVGQLCLGVIALIGAVVWSLLARKAQHHRTTQYWFHLLLRALLCKTLLGYGIAKLMEGQFQQPNLLRLTQDVGELSPMGLAWLFMGFSKLYTWFAGGMQIVAALFLFHRRTVALGAAISLTIFTNIVMINFCFDVPVKLFSIHYLVISGLLLLPEARRLLNVFLLDRPAGASSARCPHRKPTELVVEIIFPLAMGLLAAIIAFGMMFGNVLQGGAMGERQPQGGYALESFTWEGKALPPVEGDTRIWKQIFFLYPKAAQIRLMDGRVMYFELERDADAKTVTLTPSHDSSKSYVLDWEQDDGEITISGEYREKQIRFEGKRLDESETELMGRGFRWVNEYPHHR